MILGATIPDALTFSISSVVLILGALGVVFMRNTVYNALSLILSLFAVAVLFLEQEADFLAAVQIIVYAGAIVVLFLFVIMLIGVEHLDEISSEPLVGQRLGAAISTILLFSLIMLLMWGNWVTGAVELAGPFNGGAQGIFEISRSIFTGYLMAFEVTAAILVIAVVGAVMLIKKEGFSESKSENNEASLSELEEAS